MSHVAAPAFAHTSGPHNAKVVICGEAWGQKEDLFKSPFVGQSGVELARMLHEAGLANEAPKSFMSESDMSHYWDRSPFLMTNVLAFRPPNNQMDALCVSKTEVGKEYQLPALRQGKYVRWEYLSELVRLGEEISFAPRNLILALGGTASWALLAHGAVGSIRGVVSDSTLVPGNKTLPTYHPANILRNWANRPIVIADLLKANRESKFPEIVRPECLITVDPTLDEIAEWVTRPAKIYAPDIETKFKQIECIGFARSRSDAIVIPFMDARKPSGCYWDTIEDEVKAWGYVRQLMESPIPKIFQNGMFDLQFIHKMGIRPKACDEDTMLLHHSMYPELQKGLGFLGSIYTSHASWKLMARQRVDVEKKNK